MKNLVRCKSCGYIMAEERLGDTCPACGVPREMFEPYSDPVGESRRRILNMHLHPIAVHFPTSFAASVLVLLIAAFFLRGGRADYVSCTIKLMTLFLPLLVLAALLVGLIDGTARFRRIGRSAILKTKALSGVLFFVFAVGLAVLVWTRGLSGVGARWTALVLDAGAVACSAVLGILGYRLRDTALPGK
ncbi:MAG TPA: hypothetical protein VMT60_01650 [Candidatus Bathyarchaeia archaeon]|nr:hypothetical protein [Candidatus Bathyarchaeia archaeon]